MTLDEANLIATNFQFERNINHWIDAVIKMRELKKPTDEQREASQVLEAWFEEVRRNDLG